jgi:LPXTG-motif cell wall-anchored protein
MTQSHKLALAGKTAVVAALMSGSSLVWAQDAAAPASPAPAAETTFTPPPVLRTLPTENDVINPAAAEQAAVETVSRQPERAATAPAARTRDVAPARPAAATPTRPAAQDTSVTEGAAPSAPLVVPPQVDSIEPAASTVQTVEPVPSDEVAVADQNVNTGEDMTLIGGIAAALAALGIGAAFFARRRRDPADVDHTTPVNAAPAFVAPPPIREASIFQQFDRMPAQQTIAPRKPLDARSDIPVTDPLFSTPVVAGPITDPLFAPRNAVEPPITDPLFAKHGRFTGRARTENEAEPRTPELVS